MNRITYEGKQYEIPPKTIEVLKAEDACNAYHATHEEAYRAKFDYLKAVLTDEQIESMLGSVDIEQVDLMEVLYIVNLIDEEYSRRTNEQAMKKARTLMNDKAIKSLIDASNAVSKVTEKKWLIYGQKACQIAFSR